MNYLFQAIAVEVAATILGTALWEGYKRYCKHCWRTIYGEKAIKPAAGGCGRS